MRSQSNDIAHVALRVGLAFALLYPPFAALSDPVSWAAYFPTFVRDVPIDSTVILHVFGIVEVTLALWILSGWSIRLPSAITALLLIIIVAVNPAQFDVLFRDLSIAAMACALAVWPRSSALTLQQTSPHAG